jgi:hypothetical protein
VDDRRGPSDLSVEFAVDSTGGVDLYDVHVL